MTQPGTPTVRAIVDVLPAAADLLQRIGVDYQTLPDLCLAEASEAAPQNVANILIEAARAIHPCPAGLDTSEATLSDMVSYIVQSHHAFARHCLMQLVELCRSDASGRDAIRVVEEALTELGKQFDSHFKEEEEILFPYIVSLDEARQKAERPLTAPFKANCSPLHAIATEHHGIAQAIVSIRRRLAELGSAGSESVIQSALQLGVEILDLDLREHVYLEERVLFPRAVDLEKAFCADAA